MDYERDQTCRKNNTKKTVSAKDAKTDQGYQQRKDCNHDGSCVAEGFLQAVVNHGEWGAGSLHQDCYPLSQFGEIPDRIPVLV
jgi:hypothetical protein